MYLLLLLLLQYLPQTEGVTDQVPDAAVGFLHRSTDSTATTTAGEIRPPPRARPTP